jgi:hypothetical protein
VDRVEWVTGLEAAAGCVGVAVGVD